MLDTVIELGKTLRLSRNGLKHHRYIKQAPMRDDNNPVDFWTVPVAHEGSFDFGGRELLTSEYQQAQLYYLNYKQGDADSTKRYLFGDIYRTTTKTGEDGNFRFGDPNKGSWMALNSFQRAEDTLALDTERVRTFRASFRSQLNDIEEFLRANRHVYLHFDFDGKGWHELEELDLLNESILSTFFHATEHGYVMQAFLFKTLASGQSRVPGFATAQRHRTRVFKDEDEALDLLYGINYASRATMRKNDIKIVVLPRGAGLHADVIERFFERNARSEPTHPAIEQGERDVRTEVGSRAEIGKPDELFALLDTEDSGEKSIAQFDFIFSKAGGTQPDIDMIELAGLDRSKLTAISDRVIAVRETIHANRDRFFIEAFGRPPLKKLKIITVTTALSNVLGDMTRAKKKYQNHLLGILPRIYTDTYFEDPILLPAFVEKVEFNTRNDAPNYNLLKFDYFFLVAIQNNGEEQLMQLQSSPSYHIGLLLGKLARPLAVEIKSFEKNYVGLLSRRIGSQSDVMRLANDLRQKLVMHEKLYPDVRDASNNLSDALQTCEKYNKDECAFGFFESYFRPISAKALDTTSEAATMSGPETVA
ncbi:MAG: hypothetical protein P4L33_11035 [Capsulimonadaceae bacterium]|nr:hypothetical protein [Capsulimonadaceae bacterium]